MDRPPRAARWTSSRTSALPVAVKGGNNREDEERGRYERRRKSHEEVIEAKEVTPKTSVIIASQDDVTDPGAARLDSGDRRRRAELKDRQD